MAAQVFAQHRIDFDVVNEITHDTLQVPSTMAYSCNREPTRVSFLARERRLYGFSQTSQMSGVT